MTPFIVSDAYDQDGNNPVWLVLSPSRRVCITGLSPIYLEGEEVHFANETARDAGPDERRIAECSFAREILPDGTIKLTMLLVPEKPKVKPAIDSAVAKLMSKDGSVMAEGVLKLGEYTTLKVVKEGVMDVINIFTADGATHVRQIQSKFIGCKLFLGDTYNLLWDGKTDS